jgi:small-conductance mechanosensitive channel
MIWTDINLSLSLTDLNDRLLQLAPIVKVVGEWHSRRGRDAERAEHPSPLRRKAHTLPPRWSLIRIVSVAITAACVLILAALYLAAVVYTGQFVAYPAFWLVSVVGGIAAIGAISSHNRDCLAANQMKAIRLIEELAGRIDELEARLDEYGDQREIAGQRLVVAAGHKSLAAVPD